MCDFAKAPDRATVRCSPGGLAVVRAVVCVQREVSGLAKTDSSQFRPTLLGSFRRFRSDIRLGCSGFTRARAARFLRCRFWRLDQIAVDSRLGDHINIGLRVMLGICHHIVPTVIAADIAATSTLRNIRLGVTAVIAAGMLTALRIALLTTVVAVTILLLLVAVAVLFGALGFHFTLRFGQHAGVVL